MKLALSTILVFVIGVGVAPAAEAWIHVAQSGETLEELSNHYYGNPTRDILIRAANGFMHPDDGSLIAGERVEIPGITYHQVAEGDTWYLLANSYLGSAKRAPFLAEMNNASAEAPLSPGTIVKIPYQLLYIFAPRESLKGVTRMFLGDNRSAHWLQTYNLKSRKKKWGRGDAILIPIIDVAYTEKAKETIRLQKSVEVSDRSKEVQVQAVAQIAIIRKHEQQGRYLQMVVECQRLLSEPFLSNPQKIGVYKYLAIAYIAFNEVPLAKTAFLQALQLQPSMDLSPITVSPKIMKVFEQAQAELLAE